MDLNNKFREEKNSMQKWLKRTFVMDKLSKKLENYYPLDFEDFLKEMKKIKIDIKQRKTQGLLEKEFNGSLKIINSLQNKINEIDENINQLVYSLYDLTMKTYSLSKTASKSNNFNCINIANLTLKIRISK